MRVHRVGLSRQRPQLYIARHTACDIELRFIRPGQPDQNAYIERFNRTYREEVLSSLDEVRQITADWLERYNGIRPHAALGSLPPARYRKQMLAAETLI